MLLKLIRLACTNPLLTLKLFSWRRLNNLIRALTENRGDTSQIVRRYSDIYQATSSDAHERLRKQVKHSAAPKGDILILPIIDWGFRHQRPQHLAIGLAQQGYRVFYLATTPLIGGTDAWRLTGNPADNIYLCQLRSAGSDQGMHHGTMSPDSSQAFAKSFAAMQSDLGLTMPVIIVNHPYWQKLARALPRTALVYDCMDHHAGFADGDSTVEDDDESQLVATTDILAVSSDYLMDKFRIRRPDALMIRNGCDHAFFAQVPPTLRGRQKVAGYIGAISSWFDIALVEQVARLLPHWRFVLVGATHGCDTSVARRLPNVTFVGEVDYNTVPQYLATFDVCLIPFKINELTKATNPVKVYEYLAAGRSVISTPMPEVMKLGDKVFIADSANTFAAQIENAYDAGDDRERVKSWQDWARGEDWAARSTALATAIASFLKSE